MQATSKTCKGGSRTAQYTAALLLCALLAFSVACWNKGNSNNSNTPTANSSGKKTKRITNENFIKSLPQGFTLPADTDDVGQRLLEEYGAVFVVRGDVVRPPVIMFEDEAAVTRWQSGVKTARETIGGVGVELQEAAMRALKEARAEAEREKLSITPRGADAARRGYNETLKLWQSRVNPGLTYWVKEGQLNKEEADKIRTMNTREQVAEILRLEQKGLYFSMDFKKSILYSVAAPGASQHISMLAFDVKEYENAKVRAILARHNWFQTITSDLPHFTFLGVSESELPSLGLKKTTNSGRTFWIPQLTS